MVTEFCRAELNLFATKAENCWLVEQQNRLKPKADYKSLIDILHLCGPPLSCPCAVSPAPPSPVDTVLICLMLMWSCFSLPGSVSASDFRGHCGEIWSDWPMVC